MSKREVHFSERTARLAERFQRAAGSAGELATSVVAGSSSPSYLQLTWRSVPANTVSPNSWIELPGNSSAGIVPRLWRTAFVLSMLEDEARALQTNIPDARPAVAIRTQNQTQIGTHPDLEFGSFGLNRLAVAGREGRGLITVTAGYLAPASGELVVPASLEENGIRINLEHFKEPGLSNIQIT